MDGWVVIYLCKQISVLLFLGGKNFIQESVTNRYIFTQDCKLSFVHLI